MQQFQYFIKGEYIGSVKYDCDFISNKVCYWRTSGPK